MGILGKEPRSKRSGTLQDNIKKNLRGTGRENVCHEVDACGFQSTLHARQCLRTCKVILVFIKMGIY
jgi:hypothetical protein